MYDRTVQDHKLTLCVSGKLWNRSLVMMDIETETLWSHLLGQAMEGSLMGQELKALPCDMVTWGAWLREHPNTTHLNLERTSQIYTKSFYGREEELARFVFGFSGNYGMHHCSFESLQKQPLRNVDARGLPLIIIFEPASTSARIFVRKIEDKTLTFSSVEPHRIRDKETQSLWDPKSGTAVEGPLRGKRLEPHVGIVSTTRAWMSFHPDSRGE